MQVQHNERTSVRRPMDPPVTLDDGQLDIQRAALAGGFVLAALAVAALGFWLVNVAASTGAAIVGFFGLGVSVAALAIGGCVFFVVMSEWLDRRRRVEEWHVVTLEAWQLQGASETIEHVSEWALSTDNPGHVLMAALYVHIRLAGGADTPWSTRGLCGPVLIAGRRAGELSKSGAEHMGRRFGELGLVAGRGEGKAGEWVPQTADEVIEIVTEKWGVGRTAVHNRMG